MVSGIPETRKVDLEALGAPAARVDSYMEAWLGERPLPANLERAVRYVFEGGGKRLRPLLVLWTCKAVGGSFDAAMAPAAAIECVHAFSLVHDDLPAMDDDDLRRGRPTLHKHSGEALAILTGDLLFGAAFELVSSRVEPPALAGRIAAELARASNDMIAGQVYDTLPEFSAQSEGGPSDLERLEIVHRNKTGALIRCACRMGALAGGAASDELDRVTTYAESLGLMFQVVDDLLDVTQTTEHLGKTAGKDAEQGKLTYPGLLGLDATRAEVERLRCAALTALETFDAAADPLRDMCDWVAVRTR